MFEKGKREQRASQEDAAFSRMLLWLAGAVVVELIILFVRQVYVNMMFGGVVAWGLSQVFHVFHFVGAALIVAGIVWAVMNTRAGKSARLPWALTGGVTILWLMSVLAYYLFDVGMNLMMILPGVAAVLIVVFFLYQREFFYNAMLAGGGLAALWVYRQYYWTHPTMTRLFFIAGLVVLAVALVLSFLLMKNDGKLGKLRVLPLGAKYVIGWITCVVTAVAMILTLVMGETVAYYLMFVLGGWLFVQAVFFTVKMM